ncbi:WD40 repeat-like protein [Penicillium malachiteum]|uniref:WD40 repeat-like protein n=1 Tax=Penicillium malachiteum TaxID=1324776 RepID=UPI00254835E2|nr:WD40 repeat-like protein [Penicillium malachiteum]KAJ5730297.1 WD40 repeat-like protein [Penicillium malachiteum]
MNLAIRIPQMMPVLQEVLRAHPGIATKTMREQFEKLILQPLQKLKPPRGLESIISIKTMVIVIDALDECEGDDDIRLILQLLPKLKRLTSLRLRVLLTSRPDLPVRLGFSRIASEDHKDLILHDIPEEVIEHDIALFLERQLAEIRTERSLPTDWPGDEDFRKLITIPIPLFIFAATICRMLGDPIWDPRGSLAEVFAHQNDLSELDRTYLPVLNRLLHGQHGKQKSRLISEFQQVIGSIVILQSPLSILSLSKFIDLPADLIRLRLDALHSVVRVPDNETIPIRLFHLSFRDFLLDPETAQKTSFWMNEANVHHTVTMQCLYVCHSLRRNICELPSVGTRLIEIDLETIDKYIAPELQYACKYWVYHLVRCNEFGNTVSYAFSFLRSHFLHWVETMILLDLASDVLGILRDFQIFVSVSPKDNQINLGSLHIHTNSFNFQGNNGSPEDFDFLHDTTRFILKNRRMEAPLQVYCAGLVFAPGTAIIRRQFDGELPNWISQLPTVEQEWVAELDVLEGHSEEVRSVAFSPDSRLLASGSMDGTICLWDPATGSHIQTLNDANDYFNSVVFSPDSRMLAAGSNDGTVRLWDPVTGALVQTLTGKRRGGVVNSVAFSPNGRLLVSGSDDKKVYLWDPVIGRLKRFSKAIQIVLSQYPSHVMVTYLRLAPQTQ